MKRNWYIFIDDWWWILHCVWCQHWQVNLMCIRMQTEQTRRENLVSRSPAWPILQFLPQNGLPWSMLHICVFQLSPVKSVWNKEYCSFSTTAEKELIHVTAPEYVWKQIHLDWIIKLMKCEPSITEKEVHLKYPSILTYVIRVMNMGGLK